MGRGDSRRDRKRRNDSDSDGMHNVFFAKARFDNKNFQMTEEGGGVTVDRVRFLLPERRGFLHVSISFRFLSSTVHFRRHRSRSTSDNETGGGGGGGGASCVFLVEFLKCTNSLYKFRESLSIAETNKLRAQLGLAPLEQDDTPKVCKFLFLLYLTVSYSFRSGMRTMTTARVPTKLSTRTGWNFVTER